MSNVRKRAVRWLLAAIPVAWIVFANGSARGEDYYPSHEKVVAIVDRGITYLEALSEPSDGMFANGGPILVALATFKVKDDPSHPLVVRGLNLAQRAVRGLNGGQDEKIVYNASIAAMLLSTVDPQRYQTECLALRDFFVRVQRNQGGFGYLGGLNGMTGDTSQTQYVVLALWSLDQAGIEVPISMVENAAKWLKSTQDPSGRWGYQGIVANTSLVAQELPASHSLTAAGLSATLIAGDFMGFYRTRRALNEEEDVPKAFRRVVEIKEGERRKFVSMRKEDLESTVQRGVRWNAEHEYVRPIDRSWHYYYRYSEERFESFLEISRGRQEKSPAWYNRGVEELMSLQSVEGGWGIQDRLKSHCSPEIATAFAILYLIRSTQSSFGKLNEGVVSGGLGLPKNTENIIQINGKIVDKSTVTSIDELLKLMEEQDASEKKLDDALVSERLRLDPDPNRRKEQLIRLSRLLNSSDYRARRAAAKLLARGDDLDAVPPLIFALSDPDSIVPKIAENSLHVLSRQAGSPILSRDGANPSELERRSAIDKWKAWYLSVRPDYVFVDRG